MTRHIILLRVIVLLIVMVLAYGPAQTAIHSVTHVLGGIQ